MSTLLRALCGWGYRVPTPHFITAQGGYLGARIFVLHGRLKDGRPIRPSSRVKPEEKPDGTLSLVIDDVRPEDAGTYSVVAENDAGKAESEADVKSEFNFRDLFQFFSFFF